MSIRPNNPEIISSCRLQMISLSGQLVLDYNVSFDWLHREYTAATQDLPAGIYILRIFHNENLFTFKIVKL
ncbi:MAG: T9SS type A sorting domain-containing protein [Bacteroidia bacterium]|nr:T9SS type A sorting domain-containing protein [Bacteroidia bacterium]